MSKTTTHTVKIRNTHGELATLTVEVLGSQDPAEVAVEEFCYENPEYADAELFASVLLDD